MVPQDGFLFDATMAENVRMGRPRRPPTRRSATAFVRLGLDWWVAGLPDGLDTPVGERGENLSVGERQLVALARAQLADPGSADPRRGHQRRRPRDRAGPGDALVRLSQGRTTVSVAHRLSTAEAADLVLVFDAGRLVESGSHAELVAAGGRYAALYESWLGNTQQA